MKRLRLLLLLMLYAACSYGQNLILASYNVRHGEDEKGEINLEAQANALKTMNADFIALQEIDSCATRSGKIDEAKIFGKLMGMHYAFADAIPFQGGKYGVALLSKEKPRSITKIPMPNERESRVLLVVEFERCVVACTHLPLSHESRMEAARIMKEEAQSWVKPFFIMGDWNDTPDSELLQFLGEEFRMLSNTSEFTFPSGKPKECIDYIATRKSLTDEVKVESAFVGEFPVESDHRPVCVRLTVDFR